MIFCFACDFYISFHSLSLQGAEMFTASWAQLRLELLVCDRSVLVNLITHTFVWLKCLTETKIEILCDHVDHNCYHIVEMGCQMVQLLSAHIVYLNSKETSSTSEKKYKNHRQAEYHHTLKVSKILLSAVHKTHTWDLSFMKQVCYELSYPSEWKAEKK